MEEFTDVSSYVTSFCNIYPDVDQDLLGDAIWEILAEKGYTSYNNEIEYNRVLVRVVVVCEFIDQCTKYLMDDDNETTSDDLIADLNINKHRLAQLVGPSFKSNESLDEEDLSWEILGHFIELERALLEATLTAKFPAPEQLINFLGPFYYPNIEDEDQSESESIWDLCEQHNLLRMIQWISNGFPR